VLERPDGGERAILVQIASPGVEAETALAEFKELALSANAEVLACISGTRAKPDAKYYVGLGKAEEIREQVVAHDVELVLVNHELTPSQERNLERLLECRVVGRSGLILDIFAQRARTFEGKLQVELAQLQHLSTRLIRGWTHLESQKGGIGLKGPGETQLETDRRLLKERIKIINKRLEKVRLSRDQNRRARQKASIGTVSLVGYTNAGKSSLFNALTGAKIYAADKLFATLDPTTRKLELPGSSTVILADTVGFIRDLPHQLVAAFHATLEETREADLLLHVIDRSDPHWRESEVAVEKVLKELEVDDIKLLKVFNKIDMPDADKPTPEELEDVHNVFVSAVTGEGLDTLCNAIATQLHGKVVDEEIELTAQDAKLRARLYEMGAVLSESITDTGGWKLHIRMSQNEKQRVLI
jgi:GTP-binding protein HflX